MPGPRDSMLYTLRWFAGDQRWDLSPDVAWLERAQKAGYVRGGGMLAPAALTDEGRAELARLEADEGVR